MASIADAFDEFETNRIGPEPKKYDQYMDDPLVNGLLAGIHKNEGFPAANETVGYKKFKDDSDHPNIRVPFNSRGDVSTAAGKYQILKSTWDDQKKKQGLPDFTEENQKRAAIGLLDESGALDAINNGDIESAVKLAGKQWAGLPGSTIGIPTGQRAKPYTKESLKDFQPRETANGISSAFDQAEEEIAGRKQKPVFNPEPVAQAPMAQPEQNQTIPESMGMTPQTKSLKELDIVGGFKPSTSAISNVQTLASMPAGLASVASKAYTYLADKAMPGSFPVEKRDEIANKINEALTPDIAGRFGVDVNSKDYKDALLTKVMGYVGENVEKGVDKIAEETGLPKSDVDTFVNLIAIPGVMKGAGLLKGAGKTTSALEEQFAAKKGLTERVEPTLGKPEIAPENLAEQPTAAEQLNKQFQQKGIEQLPVEKSANESIANMEKTGNISVPEENPPMPTAKPTAENLSEREQVLRDVGMKSIRQSALEGNPKEASAQLITSKADQGPYATGITQQINHEKTVLNNHFEKITADSGGTVVRYGTPEEGADKMAIGKTIKSGLEEGHQKWIKEGQNLYKEAEKVHGDKPVTIEKFDDFLNKDENFTYTEEKNLQSGIKTYMQRAGLLDENGAVKPMNVKQAEELRKFINNKYNYQTAQLGGQLKGLIDNQVFEQVGGKTYQDARSHWGKGKDIYENPKATGDLLSDQGVNQKIADEAVMTKLSALPESQFSHIVNTLKSDGQTSAVNQIKTSLVDQVRRAGQSAVNEPWNSVKAAKEAAKLSQKLKVAFADDKIGLAKFYKGIEAGNISHIPNSYPGAAVQTHLLKSKFSDIALKRGISGTMGATGGLIGSAFGPGGTAVGAGTMGMLGEVLGGRVAGSRQAKRQIKQLGKEVTNLRDIGK